MVRPKKISSNTADSVLARSVDSSGFVMSPACRQCLKVGKPEQCRWDLSKSTRCSRCLVSGANCSLTVSDWEFRKLAARRAALKKELRDAQSVAAEAFSKASQASAKVLRLEKQMDRSEEDDRKLLSEGLAAADALEQQELLLLDQLPGVSADALPGSSSNVDLSVDWFSDLVVLSADGTVGEGPGSL